MILVTGGTGTVGSELVRLLVERGEAVRLLARDPDKVEIDGVEACAGDLARPETLPSALAGVDHAFLLTPFVADQYTLQANLIEAAASAGGIHVVKMDAIGTAPDAPFSAGRQFARSDELVKASGLDWTILVPHAFMQNTLGSSATISGEGVLYGCSGDGRIGTVDTRDIAAVAAAVLAEPGHAGQTYVLTGPESISYSDMAATLSSVLGREVGYVDVPLDAYRESLLGFGLPDELADDIVALYGRFFRDGGGDLVTTAVEDVTGAPARNFETFARDHAVALGGA